MAEFRDFLPKSVRQVGDAVFGRDLAIRNAGQPTPGRQQAHQQIDSLLQRLDDTERPDQRHAG